MPVEIANSIQQAIKEWTETPAAKEKLQSLGLVGVANTPDEMRVTIEQEIESIRPLVDAGLVQPT